MDCINAKNIWILHILTKLIMKCNPFRMNLANKHKDADEK